MLSIDFDILSRVVLLRRKTELYRKRLTPRRPIRAVYWALRTNSAAYPRETKNQALSLEITEEHFTIRKIQNFNQYILKHY